MDMNDNLPAAGWLSTLMLSLAGVVYSCFYFITSTRTTLSSHDKRLERLESDMRVHLVRLEEKIDKVILHIGRVRSDD